MAVLKKIRMLWICSGVQNHGGDHVIDLGIFGFSKTPTLFDWLHPEAIH